MKDGNWDIWTYDIAREVTTRITSDPAPDTDQIWSADGRRLIYTSQTPPWYGLVTKVIDGSEPERRATSAKLDLYPVA